MLVQVRILLVAKESNKRFAIPLSTDITNQCSGVPPRESQALISIE
jgi:hypothetical protein